MRIALAGFLLSPPLIGADSPLSISVRVEPPTTVITATVYKSLANRLVVIELDCHSDVEDFYRRSDIPLDEHSAPQQQVSYRYLPRGECTTVATLVKEIGGKISSTRVVKGFYSF